MQTYAPQLQNTDPNTTVLGEVATAVKQMPQNMAKPNLPVTGLERLSVPSWDGPQKTFITWKKEFNHWMNKYEQDKDEKLLWGIAKRILMGRPGEDFQSH